MDVYEQAAAPIIEGTMEGYNGTVFAYGQTGAGGRRPAIPRSRARARSAG